MTYYTQSKLAFDADLADRVTACVALEGMPDPAGWPIAHRWELSAQPGWDAAYASAIAAGIERPGREEGVITDPMILASVQAIRTAETPPAPLPDPAE